MPRLVNASRRDRSLRNIYEAAGPIGERARRGNWRRSIATSAPRRQDDRRTGRAMPETLPTPPKSIFSNREGEEFRRLVRSGRLNP